MSALFLARRRDSAGDVLSSPDLAASGLEIRWASGEREEPDWKEEELEEGETEELEGKEKELKPPLPEPDREG